MKKERSFLERLAERAELPEEPLPMEPIVELAGNRRVLIENHRGVFQYTREEIGVRMDYGSLTVCGCGLTLCRMTRERLVIAGRIDSVRLTRRDGT